MKLHRNAKTTPYQRALLVERVLELGWAMTDAAQAAGVSMRTGWRWLARYREGGLAALEDRSCAPHRIPHRTRHTRVCKIERLRRRRKTAVQIATQLHMPRSTVSAVLSRLGLERLSKLSPKPAPVRYERDRSGELLHLDVKKLGKIKRIGHRIHGNRQLRSRGAGWEFLHVCVDDASRTAYVEVLPDETGISAEAFLRRAIRWFRRRGIRVQSVMTDNGSCYVSKRFNRALAELGLTHLYTPPYRPQPNGKAERFIQTMLREWAYARSYRTSNQRTKALPKWLRFYNQHRPHSALGHQPPQVRLRRDREQPAWT